VIRAPAPRRRVLVLLFLVTAARPARADQDIPVTVEDCGEVVSAGALAEALDVELRGAEDRVRDYLRRAHPRARIRCEAGDLAVEVTADDGLAVRESVRADRLGLTRFLAIAIAESVAARAATAPTPVVAPVVPPTVPAVTPEPPPATPERMAAWLFAGGTARLGGTPAWWSGGGTVGVELATGSLLTVQLDLGLVTGGVDVDVGRVEARQASAALGARLGTSFGWLRVEGGAALHAGAVMWTGRPSQAGVSGETATTPWLGPAGALVVSAALGERVRLRLFADAGGVVASASADGLGSRFARLDPLWLSAGIGLAVRVTP